MAKEAPVRGDVIKKAFQELNLLGRPLTEAIIEHIESHGFKLDKEHYYALNEIEGLLDKVFGDDAARLLVARLRREIQ